MKRFVWAVLLSVACFQLDVLIAQPVQSSKYKQLVWSDEFDYSGLPDPSKWSYDTAGNAQGWGNNEWQHYTAVDPDNAFVRDGCLHIRAIREKAGGRNFTSARLITKGKGDWLYGRVEVRAKLPVARGIWPAIWMLPTDWEYGGWPDSGEIDIMEHVGYMPDSVFASVHTKNYNHVIRTHRVKGVLIKDPHDNFHTFKLEWDPDELRMYSDNIHYFTFRKESGSSNVWPFDKRFHLLLNVAVGGNWGAVKGVNKRAFPEEMVVDYVRVYQ